MATGTEKSRGSAFVGHMRTRLVSGLLVMIPFAVTLFILKLLLSSIASCARPVMRPLAGELPEYALTAIASCIAVLLIYLVGLVANYIIGVRLIHGCEALLLKLPIVKSVYSAAKHAVETFSSPTRTTFKGVAFVEFPRKGSLAVGFITGTLLDPEGRMLYNVFISTTPNPTAGFIVILPEAEVHLTDITVEEGVKMIMSVGILSPASYRLIKGS